MQKSNKKYVIHKSEKSVVGTIGEVLNVLLIGVSVYYTYKMIVGINVQRAKVDWLSYTAEVIISGKDYYLSSIDDEVELKFGHVLKFDEVKKGRQKYYRLVIERNGVVTEMIQQNKVRSYE